MRLDRSNEGVDGIEALGGHCRYRHDGAVLGTNETHLPSNNNLGRAVRCTAQKIQRHMQHTTTTVNAGNSLLVIVHVKYRFDPAILERTEILKYIGREYNNHLCHANVAVFPFLR